MAHLIDGAWIDRHENPLITGQTGLGKSWIACARDAVKQAPAIARNHCPNPAKCATGPERVIQTC